MGKTTSVIDEIVKRIVEQFAPEKVILFGSRARTDFAADSDADLLVVMNGTVSKRQQATQIDLALEGIPIPTDVIVVTSQELDEQRERIGTIIESALRDGKVLYDRAA